MEKQMSKVKIYFTIGLLIICICTLMVYSFSSQDNRLYLLQTKRIQKLSDRMFFCFGREWWFDKNLIVRLTGDDMIVTYNGGWEFKGEMIYPNMRTFPEEVKQPPIVSVGKKLLVVEFNKKIDKNLVIKIEIGNNEYKMHSQVVDCYNINMISVPLLDNSKSINFLQLTFSGEKCVFGIRSIYLM